MKYANISMEKKLQNEGNLGDYIQFIAIENLYKKMGLKENDIIRIEYWDLMDYNGEEVILPINFFYSNPSEDDKPIILSSKIHPVYLGVHLPRQLAREEFDYFISNAPIGCRDEYTYNLLKPEFEKRNKQNELYLQGCITATLPTRSEGKYNCVYLIDIPEFIEDMIPSEITCCAIRMSHLLYSNLKDIYTEQGFACAEEYTKNRLEIYRDTARLVITSRMHCAVPCIAMGIPVVFIVPVMSSRFSWLEKLIPIYTYDEIDKVNWNPIPAYYEEQKEMIIKSAINRITGNKGDSIYNQVHNWYMDRNRKEFDFCAGMEMLYNYAREKWSADQEFKYILWGVTATTKDVYMWISRNYSSAKLMAIIDEYRDIEFLGLQTSRSSCLSDYPDCYYIGTGASASMAMKKVLRELGEEWMERGIPIIP